MARHLVLTATAIVFAIGLTSCGENNAASENTTGTNATGTPASVEGAMPANWKATDACSILDKAAVAAALKQEVTETQLGLVHEPGATDAATSECRYLGADGSSIATLMTRWSPVKDNSQVAIDDARKAAAAALKAFSNKPVEDVLGLGKAAFLVPGIDSLTVFIDDARMIALTVEKVPDGASGKDIAIALARKAGA